MLALLAILLIVLVGAGLVVVLLRRRRARSRAAESRGGAHDDGVEVDEKAWAEIVKQLKKERRSQQ
ncbi:hypothetical protein HII36_31905 [Nonomuraea sp. NN258]|uniref:hypothetical protein n=1 Tax=Nonomuraea antri TaxID=2730852 RepID=UPI00156A3B76|nr:hypothetical protein [Nonomuraea antri]NRQ36406.1 hypothetical protein [Nonomuraea antri]